MLVLDHAIKFDNKNTEILQRHQVRIEDEHDIEMINCWSKYMLR